MFQKYFDVVMIDSYFDLESFEDPIKTFLTQKYYYSLNGDQVKNYEIYVKQNIIDKLDDYTHLNGVEQNSFYSVNDLKSDEYDSSSDYYGTFTFNLDAESQVYKRNVYTLLNVVSQLGGIFSLLTSFWTLIVGIYAERMLYYAALSNCYTFENEKVPQQDSVPEFEGNKLKDLPLPENSEEEKVYNKNEGGSDEQHSIVLTNTNMLKGPKQF
jgi:hypothetical protein